MKKYLFCCLTLSFLTTILSAQAPHSIARKWNEVLLEAIRDDFARPTVHARNLFHTSIAMYDAWAAYDETAHTYFLGRNVGGYNCSFTGIDTPDNIKAAQEEAMSYAVFRLLNHRFQNSPGATETLNRVDSLFDALGYDSGFDAINYDESGSAAAFGNYLAQCLINFGLQDGSNEANDYGNSYYEPINTPMIPSNPGSQGLQDPNRWQPLTLGTFIDQSGNEIPIETPEFLSPEWGKLPPFALQQADLTLYEREGEYPVYLDPGDPPYLNLSAEEAIEEEYKWGFALVAAWSSHLDPSDNVLIDISPGSIGNIPSFPTDFEDYRSFYNFTEGGDPSLGHDLNPHTNQPYAAQMVPRADYARVLAEFWADGPDSETPPGHWYTILNYVSDHPDLEKRYRGEGALLDDLEWDVKAYLALGGAVHDAAIAAWGIKGWYDYIRPISAIRYMADRGQSTDPDGPSYDPDGIILVPGFIEVVQADDPLALEDAANIGKIKLYAWKGHDYIADPETETAGVDWILAENWWPYQRPSFVTPPFAGYISGHSTFSRAAAEVLTLLTGDPFFPGGMGEFIAKKDEFLVFEDGPSVDITLQWATYRDASDQTSLSRIWGGIHPPVDDIPGRLIGEKIGIDAFLLAGQYFTGTVTNTEPVLNNSLAEVYPTCIRPGDPVYITFKTPASKGTMEVIDINGKTLYQTDFYHSNTLQTVEIASERLPAGLHIVRIGVNNKVLTTRIMVMQ